MRQISKKNWTQCVSNNISNMVKKINSINFTTSPEDGYNGFSIIVKYC